MKFTQDYYERTYAGVLGKIIGVYLGRPIEGWSHERISQEFGEVDYYLNHKLGLPLVVTDDDIAGTLTFLRALADYDYNPNLTPEQVGQTWLNYIVEGRSILWWGGLGNSTEHTAYLRLKSGIPAPRSGSREMNGKIISEQIGSQIFIDGWAMICPGDPEKAAAFARKAASVSHDGEAIYGAQVVAAMEAQAFVESDINKLLDVGVSFIPKDSIIYRLICDLRNWKNQYSDWRKALKLVFGHYGYDRYPGNCHIVPNHALVHLGLLYGEDDFQKSLMITNTSGWDTDCNSGNVGCLLGIKNGLRIFENGPDWRGPVADRLFLSTADGGRCISDAVQETIRIINTSQALAGEELFAPKMGARFHFELPGSVQGFQIGNDPPSNAEVLLQNTAGYSRLGKRSLAIEFNNLRGDRPVDIFVPTFILPDEMDMPDYLLEASPTLYPGQEIRAGILADERNEQPITYQFFVAAYKDGDRLYKLLGPDCVIESGTASDCVWRVPDTNGAPIAQVGIELSSGSVATGAIYLDYLTWYGTPQVEFRRPGWEGNMWRRAWVNAVDHFDNWPSESFRPIQNVGRGFLIHGCREWSDYCVQADITPQLMKAGGIAAYFQGMRRYYSLLLCAGGKIQLIKALDGDHILAEADHAWRAGETYHLQLGIHGTRIQAFIGNRQVFSIVDVDNPLSGGGIALVCEDGCFTTSGVAVVPIGKL